MGLTPKATRSFYKGKIKEPTHKHKRIDTITRHEVIKELEEMMAFDLEKVAITRSKVPGYYDIDYYYWIK